MLKTKIYAQESRKAIGSQDSAFERLMPRLTLKASAEAAVWKAPEGDSVTSSMADAKGKESLGYFSGYKGTSGRYFWWGGLNLYAANLALTGTISDSLHLTNQHCLVSLGSAAGPSQWAFLQSVPPASPVLVCALGQHWRFHKTTLLPVRPGGCHQLELESLQSSSLHPSSSSRCSQPTSQPL